MNLYKFHKKPHTLHRYSEANDTVPDLIKDALKKNRPMNGGQPLTTGQLKAIAKDAKLAFVYSFNNIRKQRFPEGEEAISKSPRFASKYAHQIIRGRFPEGEDAIATDPKYAYQYADKIIRGVWPKGEKAIGSNAAASVAYAKKIIKGKWPRGENAIATNHHMAYVYAKDIIKGPWKMGEDAILENVYTAVKYAKNVIKDKWPPLHDVLYNLRNDAMPRYEYNRFLEEKGYGASDMVPRKRVEVQ